MDINKNIFLTTAISYTNGPPHIGHLYEIVLADFVKRWFKLLNYNILLMTGTDEHGQKIEKTANDQNIKPIDLCNQNSELFKNLANKLNVQYDHFIRTTDSNHIEHVKKLFEISQLNGNIYLGKYSGLYLPREERFITEKEANETNGLDPVTGIPYIYYEEESYFFRLSEYIEYIKTHISNNIIIPCDEKINLEHRLNNGLDDLSITRTSFKWGIPINDDHVIYVWFDALLNYYTGLMTFNESFDRKTINLIGKDILWFHAVIYPAILKSVNLEKYVPENILVHGFITDENGQKMSKSLGNVILPDELFNEFSIESIRFYLIWETEWNKDVKFNKNRLKEIYNNILIKSYGNLVQRIYCLMYKELNKLNGYTLEMLQQNSLKKYIIENANKYYHKFDHKLYDIYNYKREIEEDLKNINTYLTDQKPWLDTDEIVKYEKITKTFINVLNVSKKLWPIIPNKIEEIYLLFGLELTIDNYNLNNLNLTKANVKIFIPL